MDSNFLIVKEFLYFRKMVVKKTEKVVSRLRAPISWNDYATRATRVSRVLPTLSWRYIAPTFIIVFRVVLV